MLQIPSVLEAPILDQYASESHHISTSFPPIYSVVVDAEGWKCEYFMRLFSPLYPMGTTSTLTICENSGNYEGTIRARNNCIECHSVQIFSLAIALLSLRAPTRYETYSSNLEASGIEGPPPNRC
jgi:hypothetical protein